MKIKMLVVLAGVIGSSLIIYGSLAQSSAGFFGLVLAVVAIIVAGVFRNPPRSEGDKSGAKAGVIAAVLGH